MPVTTIYLLRHALRLPYSLDVSTGTYSSSHPFPTRLPVDPPLASAGVSQTYELAHHLSDLLGPSAKTGTLRVYSSRFYRCLETLRPWVQEMSSPPHNTTISVRGEPGIGEWFGYSSRWTHPQPLSSRDLHDRFFPFVSLDYSSDVDISPDPHGESIADLHSRMARSLSHIIQTADSEFESQGRGNEDITLLLCFHAAPMIAAGRVLTGQIPEDWTIDDFKCFTAGISKFTRIPHPSSSSFSSPTSSNPSNSHFLTTGIPPGSTWTCVSNSDTSFLPHGPERGWHFNGDESFDTKDSTGGSVQADIYGFAEEPQPGADPTISDKQAGEGSKL